jgi:hypothetical protein
MISSAPPFLEGEHYHRRAGRWVYVVEDPVDIVFDLLLFGTVSFRDSSGREWARFTGNVLTVREGYAWDGPTSAPKFRGAMLASLVHDVLYQFLFTEHMRVRISKEDADNAFYDIMRLERFALRGVYYFAVKSFGKCYLRDRNNVHSVLIQP